MRTSLFFLFALCSTWLAAQTVPRFTKYDIGTTGCKVYLPAAPDEFEMEFSDDKSEVYTGEVTDANDYNFAVILVKFSEPIGNDAEVKTEMIESYLDFLQGQFGILSSAGYGRGHTLESAPNAVGVIDFWEDNDHVQYAVKSWCDGNYLSVLLLYGSDEYPIFNAQQMFLDGFRFPDK